MRAAVSCHLLLAATAIAVVGGGGLVHAQAGVGIDPGEISGLPPVTPGESVTVAVQVRNPGTEAASYEMIVQPLADVPELPPDPEWFAFEPATVDLDGGEQAEIQVELTPADGVDAGNYLALLTAQLVLPEAEGSGARVGAAVATKFLFTVAETPDSGGVPTWVFLAGGGVLVAGLAVFAVKKSGVRLKVERSRP
jgi:hypothetical protein